MSNRKKRDQNRKNARILEFRFREKAVCPECKEKTGGCYVPPSLGGKGFYMCHIG